MKTNKKTNPNRVDPKKLLPDFDNLPGDSVAKEETFWLGLTADCPLGQIDVAGLHFPRYNENIEVNPQGQQVRTPQSGTLNGRVTRTHFEALVEVLPRLVVRIQGGRQDDRSGAQNTKQPDLRQRAVLIKIPDERMIAGATAHGRALKPYIRQDGDVPAAEFMYFHHAPDGRRGKDYVSIAEAGLEWPERPEPKAAPEPSSEPQRDEPLDAVPAVNP